MWTCGPCIVSRSSLGGQGFQLARHQLAPIQAMVVSFPRQELVVGPLLDDPAVPEIHDLVRVLHRRIRLEMTIVVRPVRAARSSRRIPSSV